MVREPGKATAAMAAVAQGVADPTRLAVMQVLATDGPQTVPEIALAVGVFGSRLGNHLAKLRRAGLVTVTHRSRQAIYSVSTKEVRDLLDALAGLSTVPSAPARGRPATPSTTSADPAARNGLHDMVGARSCYGHLAGRVGVALFDHLLDAGAIHPLGEPADALEVRLGDPGPFMRLGVDPRSLDAGRRRLAYCCLDWSENRPHLGGVLADALLDSMLERGHLTRVTGSRALHVTARGKQELAVLNAE